MQGIPTPTPESIGLTTGTTGLNVLAAADEATARTAIGAEQEIEVFENANGTVIRLPRIGRQICTAASTNNIIANAASGSLFFSVTWLALTFPAEFTTLTSLVVSGRGIPGVATGWAIYAGESTTGFAAYSYATVNGGGCRVSYIAIGTYTP